ncbi:MAG: hypothetical protein IBJ18_07765 [Phycisphaerales bacterium]|nr:hypothetical protein [Phycisphaerales bacterium]
MSAVPCLIVPAAASLFMCSGLHAQVTLPSTGTLSAVSTWRSVQLPTSAMPASTGYAAYRLQLSWTNVSGATSAGARFMLTNEAVTGGTLVPSGGSAFAYVAPTSSVWSSGSRSDGQPASLTSIGAMGVPVIRGEQAPPLFLCYRQLSGSATWSVASLTLLSPVVPPTYDLPSGAIEIPNPTVPAGGFPVQGTTVSLTNVSALTIDEPVPACVTVPRRVVWYRFTPSKRGTYRITPCESLVTASQIARPLFVAVYASSTSGAGSVETLSPVACANSGCGTSNTRGDVLATLEAGTTYCLAAGIESFAQPEAIASGTWDRLTVAVDLVQPLPPPPLNQTCGSALVVPPAEIESGQRWTDTRSIVSAQATRAPMLACGEGESFYSLWYAFTPQSSGSYEFSTCATDAPDGNLLRTRLQVFTDVCESPQQPLLVCSDGGTSESCGGVTGRAKVVPFLSGGTKVYIVLSRPGSPWLQASETVAQIAIRRVTQVSRCSPADIADDAGNPLPSALSNSGVNEGDYNAFFSAEGFFAGGPVADIAFDDGEPLPPFGQSLAANNGVNEGDYNAFFNSLFLPCP